MIFQESPIPEDCCQVCEGFLLDKKFAHFSDNDCVDNTPTPEIHGVHPDCQKGKKCMVAGCDEKNLLSFQVYTLEESAELERKLKLPKTLCCCSYKKWCVFSCCIFIPLLSVSITGHILTKTNPFVEIKDFFCGKYPKN